MRNIKIIGGSSHPALAKQIADKLNQPLVPVTLGKFSNKETSVTISESVRESDVYIIQSGTGNVNDHIMELLILIAACKTASAKRVTVVIPCFPYARQPETPFNSRVFGRDLDANKMANLYDGEIAGVLSSRAEEGTPFTSMDELDKESGPDIPIATVKHKRTGSTSVEIGTKVSTISKIQSNVNIVPLEPAAVEKPTAPSGYRHWAARSGTLIAELLMAAGADHIITLDLHDAQFQGFFDIPVDNLFAQPLMLKYIKTKIPDYQKGVIVSPDAGGAKRATLIANKLNMEFALIHKERKIQNGNSEMILVGDVTGKPVIMVDDIADTSFTITRAAQLLKLSGATKIYALISHGILSGDAIERIEKSAIDEVVISNSVPQEAVGKIKIFDISSLFGEAIRRIHNGESVSFLFEQAPY